VDLTERVIAIFTKDADGHRPVFGGTDKFQHDPHWQDLLQFFDYFHGDNGAGLGASHQTGWTGVIANYIQLIPQLQAGSLDLSRQWPLATYYRRPLR